MSGCFNYSGDVLSPYGDFLDVYEVPSTLQKIPLAWTNCSWFDYHPTEDANWASGDAPCRSTAKTWASDLASPFAYRNASFQIRRVIDGSGPDGQEDAFATRIDFSGAGAEGMIYVGAAMFDSPDIEIHTGDCFTADFWIKSVPDPWTGYDCGGTYDIGAGIFSVPGAEYGSDADGLIVSSSWQHFVGDININTNPNPGGGDPTTYPTATFSIATTQTYTVAGLNTPRGSVLVKCVHLYPCGNRTSGVYGIRRVGAAHSRLGVRA